MSRREAILMFVLLSAAQVLGYCLGAWLVHHFHV